jgi:hypothetical protein
MNGEPPSLVAWDLVTQSPVSGDITIQRHSVEVQPPTEATSPSPVSSDSATPSDPLPSTSPR